MNKIVKMHGLGNDILILDQPSHALTSQHIKQLAHRKQGIGFDQCIVIQSIQTSSATIQIFNADSQQVYQCGNGLRCLMVYLHQTYALTQVMIHTGNFTYEGQWIDGIAHINMGQPSFLAEDIPTLLDTRSLVTIHLPEQITMGIVFIGNPHAICLEVNQDRDNIARKIQQCSFFPEGINVSFLSHKDADIALETYERGVGKTDACGSAACAAALIKHHFLTGTTETKVHFQYGNLTVVIKKDGVWQSGPATLLYTVDSIDLKEMV